MEYKIINGVVIVKDGNTEVFSLGLVNIPDDEEKEDTASFITRQLFSLKNHYEKEGRRKTLNLPFSKLIRIAKNQ